MRELWTADFRAPRAGRINPVWPLLAAAGVSVLILAGLLRQISQPTAGVIRPLRMYCAAGVRLPVEQIVADYRREAGVPVEIQYGGSNTLLNQLQVNQSADADLFLAADEFYTQKAVELGLAEDVLPIAYTLPVLVVPRGNPRGVRALSDLLQPGVRIACADPDQAAIGKTVRDRLLEHPLGSTTMWDQLQRQITTGGVFKPTVNDVANDLKLGAVDAGFIWDSTSVMPEYRDALETIASPELAADPDVLALTVLKASPQRPAAARFARYLTARDRGLTTFREFGVQPVDGDVWVEQPQLNFFCGAINRRVVDQIVQDFSREEGVEVNTIYDGCGILTSRMRGIDGQQTLLGFPDLYMACDRYYLELDDVRQWFQEAAFVSEADLVLVVPKGTTRVRKLADLVQPGVRVAIGQPDQCTIGVLSWRLLEQAGLADALRRKQMQAGEVVVEKSSSALLVPDVLTGHVDAAIAYVTDTLPHRDQVDVLSFDLPDSVAVQPLSIARSSEHKYLARRLFRRIAESEEAFETAGFRYRRGADTSSIDAPATSETSP